MEVQTGASSFPLPIPATLPQTAKKRIAEMKQWFDRRLHRRMNAAKNHADWSDISNTIVGAFAHDNLRGEVLDHFMRYCPEQDLKDHIRLQLTDAYVTVTVANTRAKYDSSLIPLASSLRAPAKGDSKTRSDAQARRAANRAERHARQPLKGQSGGGGNKQHGKKKNQQQKK
jgi:hypothetical protein